MDKTLQLILVAVVVVLVAATVVLIFQNQVQGESGFSGWVEDRFGQAEETTPGSSETDSECLIDAECAEGNICEDGQCVPS